MAWDRLCKHKNEGGMGFRNLREFNLALLGKQGWRVLRRPDSLAARILKARYFPRTGFLEAKIGNNPSYVWRSMLEAQDVVRKGVRWCVGDGSGIKVLGEPWLPDLDDLLVHSDNPALQNAKVYNLMKINEREWDDEVMCWAKERGI